MADLPERMYGRGRLPDPHFDPKEPLYHRCDQDGTEDDPTQPSIRRLKAARLRYLDLSVNRGKYSEPEDVLLFQYPRYADWGVACFLVEHIPSELVSVGGAVLQFRVEHDPEPECYSHSEVRSFKDNVRIKNTSQVPETVKSQFRQYVSERSLVIRQPLV